MVNIIINMLLSFIIVFCFFKGFTRFHGNMPIKIEIREQLSYINKCIIARIACWEEKISKDKLIKINTKSRINWCMK